MELPIVELRVSNYGSQEPGVFHKVTGAVETITLIEDGLTSTSSEKALSASQGKALKDTSDAHDARITALEGASGGMSDDVKQSMLKYFRYLGSKDSTGKTYTDEIRASILNMEEFANMGTGLFIHWGVYSVPAGHYEGVDAKGNTVNKNITYNTEWSLRDLSIPLDIYKTYEHQFTATAWDPDAIAQAVKDAGMGYIIITAKHHEGFSLYPTNYGNWDVRTAACRNTILDELKEACDRNGLKFGLYYSQYWDWMSEGGFGLEYQGKWNGSTTDLYTEAQHLAYCNKAAQQIAEMVERYHPFVLWYDPGTNYAQKYKDVFIKAEEELYPELITNDRLDYNRSRGDFGTGERTIYVRNKLKYAESCFTLNDTWGYSVNNDNKYFGEEKVFKQFLLYTLAYGQNCLLNFGPKPDGSIPDKQMQCLTRIGDFARAYGSFKNRKRVCFNSMPKWGYMMELDGNKVLCYIVAKGNTGYSETVIDCIDTTNLESVDVLTNGSNASAVIGENKVTVTGLELDSITKVGVVRLNYSMPPMYIDANLLGPNDMLPSRTCPMKSGMSFDFTNLIYNIKPTDNVSYVTDIIWTGETGEHTVNLSYSKKAVSDETMTLTVMDVETSATTTVDFENTATTSETLVTLEKGKKYRLSFKVTGTANSAVFLFNGLGFEPKAVVVPVTGVSLDHVTLSIVEEDTAQLTATVSPSDATNKAVTWHSSDDSVLTVVDGLVTAVASGEATVTVSTVDGNHQATCAVIVTPLHPETVVHPDSIALDVNTLNPPIGDTRVLVATISPANVTYNAVEWSSDNTSVATVSNTGVVTCVGVGEANITVTTVDGGKTATCALTVEPIHPTGITLNYSAQTTFPGKRVQLVAEVTPANATNKSVMWLSSDGDKVSVADGLVLSKEVGTVTVSATTVDGGLSATCTFTIEPETYDYLFEAESLDGSATQGEDTGIMPFADDYQNFTIFGYVHSSLNPNTDNNATLYQCVVDSSPWTGLRIDADNNNYPSASTPAASLVPRFLVGTDGYVNTITGVKTTGKPLIDVTAEKHPFYFSRNGDIYRYSIDGVNWNDFTGLNTTQLDRLKTCILTVGFDYKRLSGAITTTKYRFLKTDRPCCVAIKRESEYPFYTLLHQYDRTL